jgi:hypothetical protein
MGAASVYEGAFVGRRALGAAQLASSVTRSVVLVVFGLAGAFVGGAAGSVWGALVANLIAIGVAWHQLQAAQRGHVLAASDGTGVAPRTAEQPPRAEGPTLAADSDTPENLAEVVGQADR